MADLSRSQLLVYAAVAVAVVLVGVRWVRSADASGPGEGGATAAVVESADRSLTVEPGDGLVVHVAGAVRDPGVYRLPADARVADAIERAGGPAGGAVADALNLAAKLADGQQVLLPSRSETTDPASATGDGAAAGASAGPISLGSATIDQLDTIEGIGPVTAQGILDYREEHGGVSSVEDLDEISGIGPTTMEALRGALQP